MKTIEIEKIMLWFSNTKRTIRKADYGLKKGFSKIAFIVSLISMT